jgi:hypothetical protein
MLSLSQLVARMNLSSPSERLPTVEDWRKVAYLPGVILFDNQ